MSEPVVHTHDLGKCYKLYTRPIDRLKELFSTQRNRYHQDFWALQSVSFSARPGESWGIIGRNGAGKSTLLKLIAGVTRPSTGRLAVSGRIGALLELGTGFHPELTGRENIYLNGTVLGMSRAEVRRKFDEIVDFSEVEKFIDTPVKRYSSGMRVRLAFSVAAYLEPEILLVDEVLSVGDAAFQRKSMGKMEDVSREGRTVLFVSHNMTTIRNLCQSTFLLEGGKIIAHGATDKIVDQYQFASDTYNPSNEADETLAWAFERDDTKIVQVSRINLQDHNGDTLVEVDNRCPFVTEITFDVRKKTHGIIPYWILYDADGSHVCDSRWHDLSSRTIIGDSPGVYTLRVTFPGNLLNGGRYRLGIAAVDHAGITAYDRQDVDLWVANGQEFGQTIEGQRKGRLLMPLQWEAER